MKYSLILFVLLFTGTLSAQTIKWSKPQKYGRAGDVRQVLTTPSEDVYVARSGGRGFGSSQRLTIDKYRASNLQLMRQEEYDLRYDNSRSEYDFILPFGERIYLFTSNNDRARKENRLLCQEIDYDRLRTAGEPQVVARAEAKLLREGEFSYSISPDSTHLLIYNSQPLKRREAERFDLRVFDQNMELQWERSVTLPYTRDFFDVTSLEVDEQGNAYVLGIVYSELNRLRRNGNATYTYTILAYRNGGQEVIEYPVQLPGVFINGMTMRVNNSGELVANGLYSNRRTDQARGAFFLRIDPITKEVVAANKKEFDFEVITQSMGGLGKAIARNREDSSNERRAPELRNYTIRDIVLRSDGGTVMIAEQYFVTSTVTSDQNGVTTSRDIYHYQDILLTNIRPDGTIEWTTRIPKRQVSEEDFGRYSGFVHAVSKGKIYLFFNDHDRNFKKERKVRPRPYGGKRNAVFALVAVDASGKWTAEKLGSARKVKAIPRPQVARQTARNEITLVGNWRRKFRVGVLKL